MIYEFIVVPAHVNYIVSLAINVKNENDGPSSLVGCFVSKG